MSRVSRALFGLAIGLLLAGLVLGAVALGRYLALRDFATQIEDRRLGETLGSTLAALAASDGRSEETLRRHAAAAYLDPERAYAELDDYCWDVPTTPTPFLDTAPAPGRHANASISAQQFRHPSALERPKPEAVFRIFLTGGSTAFGSGAPSAETTISGYLQARLDAELAPRSGRRYEVINAAAPAWSSTHERIRIENRLARLQPDLVLALSGNNDVHWGEKGRNTLWSRTLVGDHYWTLLDRLHRAVGAGSLPAVAQPGKRRVPPRAVAGRLAWNLRLARSALDPVPFVFALQPTLAVSGKAPSAREAALLERAEGFDAGSTLYFRESYEAIRRRLPALREAGIGAHDLSGVFDAAPAEQEIFLDRFHFGDRGNQRLADELYGLLEARLAATPERR